MAKKRMSRAVAALVVRKWDRPRRIPIRIDPLAYHRFVAENDYEACVFCTVPTPWWTALPDRAEEDQVACCPACAEIEDPETVLCKRGWVLRDYLDEVEAARPKPVTRFRNQDQQQDAAE